MNIGAAQAWYAALVHLGTALLLVACLAQPAAAMGNNAEMTTGGKHITAGTTAWFDGISSPLVEAVDTTALALKIQTRVSRFVADVGGDNNVQDIPLTRPFRYRQTRAISSPSSNGGGSHDPLTLSIMATLLLMLRYRDKD